MTRCPYFIVSFVGLIVKINLFGIFYQYYQANFKINDLLLLYIKKLVSLKFVRLILIFYFYFLGFLMFA